MPVRGAQVAHVHAKHLRSCCHVAPSTSPTSPAPQPRANAHMLRHGKLRPWHPLPHRFHVHRPFLVAAGRTKPGSTRKVPCRHGRCREARALEIRVHGSIHGKFQPVTASVPCAGRALRPRIPPFAMDDWSWSWSPLFNHHLPCCSWQDKARQHKKSAMSAWPLQRSARA